VLPKTYRFQVLNGTGQTLATSAVTVKAVRWKFNTDGTVNYESSAATTVSNSGSTITNGSYFNGTTQDNTAGGTGWLGGEFTMTVTAPTSSAGDVTLYLQVSYDGGTTWDTNGLGMPVCSINFAASGTKTASFAL
jgi:hypothetical protein